MDITILSFFFIFLLFLFFKQKTAYEMRISDWSQTCALPISAAVLKRRRIFVAQIDRDRVAVKTPCYGGLRTDQKAVGRSHSLLFPQANAIIRHRAAGI